MPMIKVDRAVAGRLRQALIGDRVLRPTAQMRRQRR